MDINNKKEFFDSLMESYTKLELEKQRTEILNSLKFIISINSQIAGIYGKDYEIMYNKEIGDLKNQNLSEKDFNEAIYAYLFLIQDSLDNVLNVIIEKENNGE